MAIQFKLRDKTAENATIYFRYRASTTDILLATPFKINPKNWDDESQNWDEVQIIKGAKSSDTKLQNAKIEKFNRALSDFRNDIEGFIGNNLNIQQAEFKKMLKNYIETNYFAHRIKSDDDKKTIPNLFTGLIDCYIQQRSIEDKTSAKVNQKPLAENTVKKYHTLQNILKTYQKNLLATDINDLWRTAFIEYLNKKQYSENTQVKLIKDIKMLCNFADKEHSISKQVKAWQINSAPENISETKPLTFEQLDILQNKIMPSEKLNNARDWLLISCYTSVRVSELMELKAENILVFNDDCFIKVTEKKNLNKGKEVAEKMVYLLPKVIEILNKRNGKFPKKISHQRYNDYIKEVCEVAGFDEVVEGGLRQGKRKVKTLAPFYKFVTSHTGRATYVTLFSDKLPKEIIAYQTNHHSEKMVDHYNKTDADVLLLQKARLVAQAHRNIEPEYKAVKLKIV